MLLRKGTVLFEKRLMNTLALTQVMISKCPDNIKSFLFQAAESATNWNTLIQRAEEVAWLAYTDKLLNRVYTQDQLEEKNIAAVHQRRDSTTLHNNGHPGDNYCLVHGRGTHKSEECRTIQAAAQRFKVSQKSRMKHIRINHMTTDITEQSDKQINEDFIYTASSYTQNNPFFITVTLFEQTQKALMDTGADISIAHISMIPDSETLNTYSGNVRSACGNVVNVTKELGNAKLSINKSTVSCDLVITDDEPNTSSLV
ncbi:hypothetical protein NGRA_1654 [Nosema granulosis]|uniref:Retropepsins domain-containing protein n=1 Tax=Nosema granulosis TaxID=83296 RepID=A0A9P6H1D5_9MICR|nr:hypothetical protein NGRA_1654 [Nosema granulosis]